MESEAGKQADLNQLKTRLAKQLEKAQSQLQQLSQKELACSADAIKPAKCFESQLRFHQISDLEIIEHCRHLKAGRPGKKAQPTHCYYQICAELVPNPEAIATEHRRAGRFILATNVTYSCE